MIHQKKSGGHRTSKIAQFTQRSGNGPITCLFYELARALMDDVACERVRSKDAQKQLARTSLNTHTPLINYIN